MFKNIFFLLGLGFIGNYCLANTPTDTTIVIKVLGGLQYDLPRFELKAPVKLTIVLDNHDDMAHNIVFTKPNARPKVVDEALKLADRGAKMDYVPASPLVLAHSKIVEPGQMERFTFMVDKDGIYPYVCTYPGHGFVMYGAVYVGKSMPVFEKDLNIPESQRFTQEKNQHQHHAMGPVSPHPYALSYPMMYRIFMPDASPAAIAVALSEHDAYCFDAGKCYLRYAWTGGFLDNTEHWKGNGNKLAKIIGQVYWRDSTGFPFRIGHLDHTPIVKFKGYSLKKNRPTFKYLLDNIEVTETLLLAPKTGFLVRKFTFRNNTKTMFFRSPVYEGVQIKSQTKPSKTGVYEIKALTTDFELVIER